MVKARKSMFSLIISLFLLVSFASALAITAPYWPGYPLTMNPGDSIDLVYDLQNMVGEDEVTIKVEIIEGTEIASLTGLDVYNIELGDGVSIPFKITIPEDAELGSKYKVTASFYSVSKDINQPVQLSTRVIKSFEVFIGEQKKTEPATQQPQVTKEVGKSSGSSFIYVIILLVIIFGFMFFRRKKK